MPEFVAPGEDVGLSQLMSRDGGRSAGSVLDQFNTWRANSPLWTGDRAARLKAASDSFDLDLWTWGRTSRLSAELADLHGIQSMLVATGEGGLGTCDGDSIRLVHAEETPDCALMLDAMLNAHTGALFSSDRIEIIRTAVPGLDATNPAIYEGGYRKLADTLRSLAPDIKRLYSVSAGFKITSGIVVLAAYKDHYRLDKPKADRVRVCYQHQDGTGLVVLGFDADGEPYVKVRA